MAGYIPAPVQVDNVTLQQSAVGVLSVKPAAGAYTGDGGTQAVAVGFRPRLVLVNNKTGGVLWIVADPDKTDNEFIIRGATGNVLVSNNLAGLPGVDITATGFTVTVTANTAASLYAWTAYP